MSMLKPKIRAQSVASIMGRVKAAQEAAKKELERLASERAQAAIELRQRADNLYAEARAKEIDHDNAVGAMKELGAPVDLAA